jgi:hypothetical protein
MRSTLLRPSKCEDCLFFERLRSPYGTNFNCRYYNKSTYSINGNKFPFCRVECIFVTERPENAEQDQ